MFGGAVPSDVACHFIRADQLITKFGNDIQLNLALTLRQILTFAGNTGAISLAHCGNTYQDAGPWRNIFGLAGLDYVVRRGVYGGQSRRIAGVAIVFDERAQNISCSIDQIAVGPVALGDSSDPALLVNAPRAVVKVLGRRRNLVFTGTPGISLQRFRSDADPKVVLAILAAIPRRDYTVTIGDYGMSIVVSQDAPDKAWPAQKSIRNPRVPRHANRVGLLILYAVSKVRILSKRYSPVNTR